MVDPARDPRLGDASQVVSTRSIRLGDGAEDGVRAIDVRVGGGLSALVLADRGLDLGPVWAAGWQVSWQSPTGIVHPGRFDEDDWLRSFHGGLMTTCGLQNVGPANEDQGISYGLHGRATGLQAYAVTHRMVKEGGAVYAEVTGELRETDVYGADLVLHRRLRFPMGRLEVQVEDVVENRGHRSAAFQLLYHLNIGWPVVAATSRLLAPAGDVVGLVDPIDGSDRHDAFVEPVDGFPALVYEHRLDDPGARSATISILNPDFEPTQGIGLSVTYDPRRLPRLWRWRMFAPGMYLTGIEPGTCSVFGRAAERAAGTLMQLEPGAQYDCGVTIAIHTGQDVGSRIEASAPRSPKPRSRCT